MNEKNRSKKIVLKIPCDTYSRIVGYWARLQNWNDGKRQEFADRKMYNPNKVLK